MKQLFSLLLLLGLLFTACETDEQHQPSGPTAYDAFIDALIARGQFNGNVLVAEKGRIIFQKSHGLNSVRGDSLSLDSQFRLASVSKQFTDMAIMTLKEAGKLDYDDLVQIYIPEWPYEATIRQLMNHTSGAPDYEALFNEQWKPELEEKDTARVMQGNEHMVAMFAEHQPESHFGPGEKYEYSNTSYVLLATIVARVSGKPFEDYMREFVFVPAGMNDTYVFSPLRDDPLKKRVYGFQRSLDGKELIENDFHYVNPVAGDGGMYSTLADLFSWDRTLYTNDIIDQITLNEAFQPAVLNSGDTSWYGFGWSIQEDEHRGKTVSHSGGWVGFRTWIDRELDQDNCVIILTNNSSVYLWGIRQGLLNILHGAPYELPKISVASEVGSSVLMGGCDSGLTAYEQLKADSLNYEVVQWQFNWIGYQMASKGQNEAALCMFEINTKSFPGSANVWDSYGDGLLAVGDTIAAVKSFEKALKLDPEMAITKEKLATLQ